MSSSARNRWVRPSLTVIIGGGLFALSVRYLMTAVDWTAAAGVLRTARVSLFLTTGVLSLVVYSSLRTLRWGLLVDAGSGRAALLDRYFATTICLGLSVITPGGTGEGVKIELFRRLDGLRPGIGLPAFVAERLADILVVVILALASLCIRPSLVPASKWLVPTLIAGGITVAILMGVSVARLATHSTLPVDASRSASGVARFVTLLVMSISSWLVVALAWEVCAVSAGVNLGFADSVALTSLVTLGSIVSLVPAGLGVSEALSVELLRRMGHPAALAVATAVLLRCYGVLQVVVAVAHAGVWLLVRPQSSGLLIEGVRASRTAGIEKLKQY